MYDTMPEYSLPVLCQKTGCLHPESSEYYARFCDMGATCIGSAQSWLPFSRCSYIQKLFLAFYEELPNYKKY